ncbi:MAG: leucyl/phenylalanyl-tRNA--protein transferase family protein [Armatimonadetes bacterium]|nr:leucyl/phenylalanyl-tRNA--protein transferase family protein [Armatimonadota bacterium]
MSELKRNELSSLELWSIMMGCRFVYGDCIDGKESDYLSIEYPERRALFFPGKVQVPRSLARRMRRRDYEVTFDAAFQEVVKACKRSDTWITHQIEFAYEKAFREGWAHSCEVWKEGRLVGGVYGLGIGKVFFAESMFHWEPGMGKIALVRLLERCFELGFEVVDAEEMKDDLALLGAVGCSNYAFSLMSYDWLHSGVRTPWSPPPADLRT